MMVSLDGYFEGIDHDISWHNVDEEFNEFAIEQTDNVGTLLFGHRTYDLMAGYWPQEETKKEDPIVARQMNETPKVVVSKQGFTAEWQNTTVVSGDVVDQLRALKRQPGKDIGLYGSNELCVSLMKEGLVDEFRIMVNPVALGKGKALFTGLDTPVSLKLVRSHDFTSGNVLLVYQPAR